MKLKDINKEIQNLKIEDEPKDYRTFVEKNKRWKIALIFSLTTFLLFFNITALALNASFGASYWFVKFYIYTIDLIFGNLVLPLILCGYATCCVLIISNAYNGKCVAWFGKYRKVSIFHAQREILIFIWNIFIFWSFFDHMILNYAYNKDFQFKIILTENIFKTGFWEQYVVQENFFWNHIGFLFDTIFNILYYLPLAFVFSIILLILFLGFIIVKLRFIFPFKMFKQKLYKITATEYYSKLKNRKLPFVLTEKTVEWFDVFFKNAKYAKLQYNSISFLKLIQELIKFNEVERNLSKEKMDSLSESEKETTSYLITNKTDETFEQKLEQKNEDEKVLNVFEILEKHSPIINNEE